MKENTKREIFSWIKTIVITLIILVVIRSFLFTTITVNGDSMYPTFENRDRIIVNRMSEIERFDMVVFDAPDADELYIKRVIGLPGDSIEVKHDVLYINGKEVEEPYLEYNKKESEFDFLTNDFTLEETTGETVIPEEMLFVMGDNRLYSKDSRSFGLISNDALVGEAAFRYFPLDRLGIQK
jgi:signal peptidase I